MKISLYENKGFDSTNGHYFFLILKLMLFAMMVDGKENLKFAGIRWKLKPLPMTFFHEGY